MVEDCHPMHHFYPLTSEPSDFGFNGVARERMWAIGAHTELTTCLEDPFELLDSIRTRVHDSGVTTKISDYLCASKAEVLLDAESVAKRRGVLFDPLNMNLSYILTEREFSTKCQLDCDYYGKFGSPACDNPDLVYHLGDSAQYRCWSATSQKIPTYRVGSKSSLYWLPYHQRWLTGKERLLTMGWPVIPEVADAMGCPMVGASDRQRAQDLASTAGNGFHFQTSGILQLISLSCFGRTQ